MNGIQTAAVLAILGAIGYWLADSTKQPEVSVEPATWAYGYRWPDPPMPGSPPGAIGGFGAPMATTGGIYITPKSASDNELLQELQRRAEKIRNQVRA